MSTPTYAASVVTTLDQDLGEWVVVFEVDCVEVMRLPLDQAVGMAATIYGLWEDSVGE